MCAFLLVQVCANYPSVVHVLTDEMLLDGCNWESTLLYILLMSLLSWPPPGINFQVWYNIFYLHQELSGEGSL